jgi:calcineurin-like phosphoesterase family protein
MIWFSADFHLGHGGKDGKSGILKYCHRPFLDVDEMDEEIIRRWNSCVDHSDTGYILGDFCFGNPIKYYDRLKGRIVCVIPGSHDKELSKLPGEFTLPPIFTLNLDPVLSITLCHYSMRSWPKSHHASWHLFGHHHGKLEPHGLSFDVGVDCWDFYPVSLDEVAKKMATLSPIVDFRKKSL